MTDKKNNIGINFPRGILEEMLRIIRECREKGEIDCEIILKEFIGKDFRSVDYEKIKRQLFGDD